MHIVYDFWKKIVFSRFTAVFLYNRSLCTIKIGCFSCGDGKKTHSKPSFFQRHTIIKLILMKHHKPWPLMYGAISFPLC